MAHVLEILEERGFVEAKTHERELYDWLGSGQRTCYVGFDPTAPSLHIGHLIPVMALAHMQRCGHRPIALVGGGTGLVGDPSGKTEMRQILTAETVRANADAIKAQLARFICFDEDRALLRNNADWLVSLGYIEFLRDIGRHFSVNRMIKAESYRMRLDSDEGLSFIEFNYMLLQAYDFLELFRRCDCRLQMGGSDQWGNIVAGIELVRKVCQQQAFGITFQLITTASGAKMGKTAAGAVWLDADRTSPYEYYQYWVNSADADVARFLALYTFLPMDEIRQVAELRDADLNLAKTVLAFETTQIVHGRQAAVEAMKAARRMFGARPVPADLMPSSTVPRHDGGQREEDVVPCTELEVDLVAEGLPLFKLLQATGLSASGGAARRLISQGGAYVNGQRVDSPQRVVTMDDFGNDGLLLRAGKKHFHRVRLKKTQGHAKED
ncbi:MAG TPA: tyrosine--tRNA ligase [Desulfobacteraceae bacterium]|nr:tyrosine--tRNA ligase [Deltaproteobacteria bacterium]MBW2355311.1 tyrosine--tRNA ligase [Deltaproteobacteria bacterium]RLB94102.1 MAG: tyrosine--tRNA ligase [Deltaproteobacteria bacterium]HDI60591.1 tyrosine--tRNA ligase [Desulfobacteraceae bacterium]